MLFLIENPEKGLRVKIGIYDFKGPPFISTKKFKYFKNLFEFLVSL